MSFTENFAPGAGSRAGSGSATTSSSAINPSIIYAQVKGLRRRQARMRRVCRSIRLRRGRRRGDEHYRRSATGRPIKPGPTIGRTPAPAC